MNIKHRMARAVRSRKVDRNDPSYEEKRRKNNEAIKRTRAKNKAKQEETQRKMAHLKAENTDLELKIKDLSTQLKLMKNILEAHQQAQSSFVSQNNKIYKLLDELNDLNNASL